MAENQFHMGCLGANFKTAPVQVREQLFLDEQKVYPILQELQKNLPDCEWLVLSTCNRCELFAISTNPDTVSHTQMSKHFWLIQKSLKADLPEGFQDSFRKYFYHFEDKEAVRHGFRVAASLDSLVVGETQITGQFKKSLEMAKQMGVAGKKIDLFSQCALSTSKKIRNQTKIGAQTVSISHAAIDLAKTVFRDLQEHSIVIVGAGEMAKLALQYCANYRPQKLRVVNRTVEKAVSLLAEVPRSKDRLVEAVSLNSTCLNWLYEADIIICAVATDSYILTYEMVQKALQKRYRPLYMVDVGMPRSIDPSLGELEELYLFDIDDLKQVVESGKKERQKAASEADQIVQECVAQFYQKLRKSDHSKTLKSLSEYLESLFNQEWDKTKRKQVFGCEKPEIETAVLEMHQAIIRKIVSDTALKLNRQDCPNSHSLTSPAKIEKGS